MDRAGLRRVDPRGVDAGVAQDVRQPGEILLQGIKRPGEEVPEVVGEDLARRHAGALAEGLHIPPDVRPVQRPPVPREKHRSGGDFLFLQVGFQQAAQLVRQEHRPALALVADLRPAGLDGLGGDKAQLRHPNPGGTDGLDHQGQSRIFLPLGGLHQPDVLGPGQLLVLAQKQRLLDFQLPQAQVAEAAEGQKPVDRRQHRIDAGRGVGLDQRFLPLQQQPLGNVPPVQKIRQRPDIVDILLDGGGAALLVAQVLRKCLDFRGGNCPCIGHESSSFTVIQSILPHRAASIQRDRPTHSVCKNAQPQNSFLRLIQGLGAAPQQANGRNVLTSALLASIIPSF